MSDLARGTEGPPRLAEVAGVLSLATDLGTGQPPGHALRTCLLSLELARRSGVASDRLRDVYYVALLRSAGCTAGAGLRAAAAAGDDLALAAATSRARAGSGLERLRASARVAGAGQPLPRRALRLPMSLARAGEAEAVLAEADAAAHLAGRLGLDEGVVGPLRAASERWAGKGTPGSLSAEGVPEPARVVAVAGDVDLWARASGPEAAARVIARRSGRAHDAAVCAAFLSDASEVLAVTGGDDWRSALDAEPSPALRVPEERVDQALATLADFADLKSPWLRGHSRGVAELAADAGLVDGLGEEETTQLRRAGLVHDLGRVAVANGVWDAAGPLAPPDWERVREHPRVTERLLRHSPALAPLARLASRHHERSDGSGYHRALRAEDLTAAEQILAGADAYQALTEDRPYRPGLTAEAAGAELRLEARVGRLDPGAVEAVVGAAQMRPRPPQELSHSGLSEREAAVLALVARGATDRQVAARLSRSPQAAGAEVADLLRKVGVATRPAAALVAMEQGLLSTRGRERLGDGDAPG